MKPKMIIKITVDMLMAILLLCLMSYSMIGEKQHEVIGVSIFMLFVFHNILNRSFYRNLFRGKYTTYRVFQTVFVILIFITMIVSMVSGIMLSRYVFSWIQIKGVGGIARKLHMLSAYWGFTFMSLHLGLHWGVICNMFKRIFSKENSIVNQLIWIIGLGISLYGIYAIIKRKIVTYLFLKNMFVFFNLKEPIMYFMFDYVAIMGLFVFIGFYLSEEIKKISYAKNHK